MKLKLKRRFIIGPYPPPIGGVSNYIYRYLNTHQIEGYRIIDYSKGGIIQKGINILFLFFYPFELHCYVNQVNSKIFAILALRFLKKDIIFYDHNFRYIEGIHGKELWIFKIFLNKCKKIQVVNNGIVNYYAQYGIDIKEKSELVVPFIPPIIEDEERVVRNYSTEIIDFIQNHHPLVVANAFSIMFYQTKDLYGIDLCLQLILKLKISYPNIGLLFGLADDKSNTDYYIDLQQFIKNNYLDGNIKFLTGQNELWPIIKKCDLFVRPTCTDGDALSIREALFFDRPVVCSDVTIRPEGVITFKNRDIEDLYQKVIKVLK